MPTQRRPLAPARSSESLIQKIADVPGARALDVAHVGSTSVPGLPAKPVIDLDLLVADPSDESAYVPSLVTLGFTLVIRQPWWYEHRALRAEDPACNLHVFATDSPETVRHRMFRDWLRENAEDRDRYATAEREAAATANRRGEDGMAYNARKQQVIREIYARIFAASGLLETRRHSGRGGSHSPPG